jgi:hypothetical protein
MQTKRQKKKKKKKENIIIIGRVQRPRHVAIFKDFKSPKEKKVFFFPQCLPVDFPPESGVFHRFRVHQPHHFIHQ